MAGVNVSSPPRFFVVASLHGGPKEKLAAFIREAIERELARREAKKRPKK
jgi:hypothetical protein